jgi:hypothetical protein
MITEVREAPASNAVRPEASHQERRLMRVSPSQWDRARLWAAVLLITGIIGLLARVGADGRWLAALGGSIWTRGSIPAGVPFAWASTAHWANTLVLAEILFHGLEAALGDRGLILANLLAVAACFGIVAADARAAGARSGSIASAMSLAALGALPSLAVARVQLFSLVLFPAMVALLRAEARQPSRRIWWTLPLLALWSNLHGAALAGLAVLYGYLLLSRLRQDRLTAAAVAGGALLALCVTPAGLRTFDYYHGLLTNVAAARGAGQWAPLGASPFDFVLIGCALLLALRLRHRRPALWEVAVMLGLAVLTVKAARDGVWLLLFLIAPVARTRGSKRDWNGLIAPAIMCGAVLVVLAILHQPQRSGATERMVNRAMAVAHGGPILADGLAAEQVALAGGRIWAGNPLDAFSKTVQSEYLDWLSGSPAGRRALEVPAVRVVLVTPATRAARLVATQPGYRYLTGDASAAVYVR